jgi:hypothetical protein
MSKQQELEAKINSSSDFISVVGLGGMLLSGILLFTISVVSLGGMLLSGILLFTPAQAIHTHSDSSESLC